MESLPGNPWWSEPGTTLDGYAKDPPREPAGRHAGEQRPSLWTDWSSAAPRHARPQPEHVTEPDPAPAAPVRTPDDRATLADLAARSKTPAWNVWVAQRLATLRAAHATTGETGKAHLAAAVRSLVAARDRLAREDPGPSLGPAVGTVAEGTATADALHGTCGDEDPVRAEGNDASDHPGPASSARITSGRPGHQPDPHQTERERDLREQPQ